MQPRTEPSTKSGRRTRTELEDRAETRLASPPALDSRAARVAASRPAWLDGKKVADADGGGGRALSPSYARLFPDAFPTAPTDRSAGRESRLIFQKSSVQVAAERAWGTSGASRERSSLGKHYYRTSPSVDLRVMNS